MYWYLHLCLFTFDHSFTSFNQLKKTQKIIIPNFHHLGHVNSRQTTYRIKQMQ